VAALEYCRARGARLVFVSSYLYGVSVNGPIPENAPVVPASPYALSKILAENVCRFYSENFGISTTILRPFNVYGPGQSAQFLIPLIIRQARSGCEIRVRDLAPKRDYVYVADVVRAIECALEGESSYGVFNIGSGVSHSVAEVISVIQDVWGTSLPVVSSEERRRNETMDTVADIAQAKACLGWSPEFSLQEGLREMCRQDAAIDPTELT
jgi:nucleoside-diphosphate-sugar epimerase